MNHPRVLWPNVVTSFPVEAGYWRFIWHYLASSVSWSADRMCAWQARPAVD